MKKIFLGLGAFAAAVSPIAVVVACGSNNDLNPILNGSKFEYEGTVKEKASAFDKTFDVALSQILPGVQDDFSDIDKADFADKINGYIVVKTFSNEVDTLYFLKKTTSENPSERQPSNFQTGDYEVTNEKSSAQSSDIQEFSKNLSEVAEYLKSNKEITAYIAFYGTKNIPSSETERKYNNSIWFYGGFGNDIIQDKVVSPTSTNPELTKNVTISKKT